MYLRRPKDELLIVDNGSDPPLPFGTIYSETNLGFCAGSNVGLKHATGTVVLFLNNDIVMTRENWLEEIRELVEPGVIVGPLRLDPHADVDGVKFPYVDGWCMAGMREDFLSLGGWDETLAEPAYYSDNFLSLEARLAGMTLRDLRPGLLHKGSSTSMPGIYSSAAAATTANRARYQDLARKVGEEQ